MFEYLRSLDCTECTGWLLSCCGIFSKNNRALDQSFLGDSRRHLEIPLDERSADKKLSFKEKVNKLIVLSDKLGEINQEIGKEEWRKHNQTLATFTKKVTNYQQGVEGEWINKNTGPYITIELYLGLIINQQIKLNKALNEKLNEASHEDQKPSLIKKALVKTMMEGIQSNITKCARNLNVDFKPMERQESLSGFSRNLSSNNLSKQGNAGYGTM